MTEIPDHLRKRAEEARARSETQREPVFDPFSREDVLDPISETNNSTIMLMHLRVSVNRGVIESEWIGNLDLIVGSNITLPLLSETVKGDSVTKAEMAMCHIVHKYLAKVFDDQRI